MQKQRESFMQRGKLRKFKQYSEKPQHICNFLAELNLPIWETRATFKSYWFYMVHCFNANEYAHPMLRLSWFE